MKKYLKFLPYILIVVVFFIGRSTAPTHDKDLIKKFRMDRKALLEDTARLNAIVTAKEAEISTIIQSKSKDSLKFSVQLRAYDKAFSRLQRNYDKINFSNSTIRQLDSVDRALYGPR